MAWRSPTGHNDPDTVWSDEANIYDDDVGSYAETTIVADSWSGYIELTVAAITCGKVRFYVNYLANDTQQIDLDVYYGGAWHDVYQGLFTTSVWVEKDVSGGEQSITKARARFHNDSIDNPSEIYFREFDFAEWTSPTGHSDPDTVWSNEANIYDEDTSSFAQTTIVADSWGSYIELTVAAIYCDKVRFYISYLANDTQQIDLDVYYSGAWHDVYQGFFATSAWVEKSIPGGKQSITKARARFHNDSIDNPSEIYFHEFDFWKVGLVLTATGIASAEAFGVGSLNQKAGVNYHQLVYTKDATKLCNRVTVIGSESEIIEPSAVKYNDVSGGTFTSYLSEVTDDDDATHLPADAMPTDDFIYIRSDYLFSLIDILMGANKNSNLASLSAEYSKGGGSWGALYIADGTATPIGGDPDSVKFYNGSAFTDYTTETTDENITTHLPADGLATTERIYIGDAAEFELVQVMMGTNKNVNNAPLLAKYSKGGGSWGTLAITDGTKILNRSFAQSGIISFEPPSDWATDTVDGVTKYWIYLYIFGPAMSATVDVAEIDITAGSYGETLTKSGQITFNVPDDWAPDTVDNEDGYFVRLSVSAALSATVDIAEIRVNKAIIVTVADEDSYDEYGEYFDAKIRDTSIDSQELATLRGEALLAERSIVIERGSLYCNQEGLVVGQQVKIVNALRSINGNYLVRSLTTRMRGGTTEEVYVSFGDYHPDLIELMRKINELEARK